MEGKQDGKWGKQQFIDYYSRPLLQLMVVRTSKMTVEEENWGKVRFS